MLRRKLVRELAAQAAAWCNGALLPEVTDTAARALTHGRAFATRERCLDRDNTLSLFDNAAGLRDETW